RTRRSAWSIISCTLATTWGPTGSGLRGSYPPVSTRRNRRPAHSTTASSGSRVTPGSSWTRATRPPTIRLNRVDLPPLGRPTLTTRGRPDPVLPPPPPHPAEDEYTIPGRPNHLGLGPGRIPPGGPAPPAPRPPAAPASAGSLPRPGRSRPGPGRPSPAGGRAARPPARGV